MKRKISDLFVVTLLLTGLLFSFVSAQAAPIKNEDVPEELLQWKSWVLYDMDDKLCPSDYNNENVYRCTWPSRLRLSINARGGEFEQEWTVFAEAWVPLPGTAEMWPEKVTDNKSETPVINRENGPFLSLKPGRHLVKGRFKWKEMPEMIHVPSETGIVDLAISGKAIDYPVIDKTGRLWLQKRVLSESQENTQLISVFRLIQDVIPMKAVNHLQINVSGQAREIRFENVLLKNSIPMQMSSPLPARIGDDGGLMIQARPGRWELEIITRFPAPIDKLGPVPCVHGREIWSFDARNHLRMVKIEGVPSVEPGRTNMPAAWKQYAAHIVDAGADISFKTLRRGNPDPGPDRLNLQRTLWLDFNGDGFTIEDNITGTISRTWRLSMNPPGKLGRVVVDGRGQLITADEKTGKPGVEIRKGSLNMKADSRYTDSASIIPAVGWDHNFSVMKGVLNLPPGWRLFAAKGIDNIPGTWLLKWTLLDFFLVLIIGAAVFKLRGWRWGLVAIITMMLVYHEPGSPKTIWLHILVAIALLPVLPEGWFKRIVYVWGGSATVILIILAIPFMVTQVRWGVFPQLELSGRHFQQVWVPGQAAPVDEYDEITKRLEDTEDYASPIQRLAPKKLQSRSKDVWSGTGRYAEKKAVYAQDPNALIQTGPGLPAWQWKSIPMTWNGPVNKNQKIKLWLLSPSVNLAISFVRVILLALMIVGIVDIRFIWRTIKDNMPPAAAAAATVLMLFAGIARGETVTTPFPPQELLTQYQARLLEKADCFPYCADCLKMDVTIQPKTLNILLQVHTAAQTAVPLPGSIKSWVPDQVILDNKPAEELSRDTNGILWILVPAGIHRILLTGKTGTGNSLQIPLPLKPHSATYKSNEWDVQGIHKDGTVDSGIQLTRLKKETKDTSLSASVSLPPFLQVERIISLGITWEMRTTVTRVTPVGTPVVVTVPLIEGESVTTAGIRVENGNALINMGPGESRVWWDSSLQVIDNISLKAVEQAPWTETWILDASPIWHCEPSGIPVVHHQGEQGQWRPTWQPWPGETVSIKVARPKAISGRMVTIDSASLVLMPGLRSSKVHLTVHVRTSQGGQHQIILPEKADLQIVKINDKTQPIRQEERNVVIPLQPGNQSIFLEWNSLSSSSVLVKGPAVHIGNQAVNAQVTFKMPANRWILWTFGPTLGPAVLYWSYILIIILIALGLGQIPITPLKTHHWLILSLGLTQIPIHMTLIVAGWFLILGVRKKYPLPEAPSYYNMVQLVVALWTLVAFVCLYTAVSEGLLGIPDMQIAGNNSTTAQLNWTQDRIDTLMPQPSVISLPKIAYNIMILIWSLWLAIYLIKWLKWGWECFSEGGLWKKIKRSHNA